jgi:hypothetical protein
MIGDLIEKGNLDRGRDTDTEKTSSEDEGRSWNDAFIHQGRPKMASKPSVEMRHRTGHPHDPAR